MSPTPGLLFVRMNPQNDLSPAEFHDWYNNEHGPTRLRLACCENGFRYRALDIARTPYSDYRTSDTSSVAKQDSSYSSPKAEWLAIYDIDDMAALEEDSYLRLRSPPWKSAREISVMSRINVDRRLYDQVYSTEVDSYKPVDTLPEGKSRLNILIVVSRTVLSSEVSDLLQWYKDTRIPDLKSTPEWRRTRLWRTSIPVSETAPATTEVQIIHEFAASASSSDQASLEQKARQYTVADSDWKSSTSNTPDIRPYELHYIFGSAPRHLSATAPSYEHPQEGTKTAGAQDAGNGGGNGRSRVESYIFTADGVKIPYLLEGSTDPEAPLIVLSNSVLVDWHIWDEFVDDFLSKPSNAGYRILRYSTRGRTSDCGTTPITVDVLASDIPALLNELRVSQAAAAIGVSLGGATVLNFALRYPDRVAAVISCDTNSSSPPGNSKLWLDRIAIAKKENATGANAQGQQEPIIGEELAEVTVRRWAVPESYDGGYLESKLQQVKQSVRVNSLSGFEAVVKALWEYDLRPMMPTATVKAIFVVGAGDGKLPTSMKEMADSYAGGVPLKVVEGAGHLPMVEKPLEFSSIVTEFLSG
ncbi:hypothetical protein PV10_05450 [Exophiala mesophila]|uniref:AB hydrolase-1 domain-containing protein n=1 Tax=Exophiala mesophila TaxID=212818 RepID=A0A0D1Z7S5_EXOME|nr:uncharacterized protein PV10_05450 [Exophiala mesophila]KIV90842.1 hypothetical protein PV10_05450 [Exophiala mesophila]